MAYSSEFPTTQPQEFLGELFDLHLGVDVPGLAVRLAQTNDLKDYYLVDTMHSLAVDFLEGSCKLSTLFHNRQQKSINSHQRPLIKQSTAKPSGNI